MSFISDFLNIFFFFSELNNNLPHIYREKTLVLENVDL